MNKYPKSNLLDQISDHLMLRNSCISDLSLYYGKMGIIIFFYHLYRFTNNIVYEEYAEILLEELYDEIHNELTYNISTGYCGIGCGITYLFNNNFVEGELNEVLEEIDNKIMLVDILRINNYTFSKGIGGIFLYVLLRLNIRSELISLDKPYIEKVCLIAEKIVSLKIEEIYTTSIENGKNVDDDEYKKDIDKTILLAKKVVDFFNEPNITNNINIWNYIQFPEIRKTRQLININLGLTKGCAGIGLNMIMSEKREKK